MTATKINFDETKYSERLLLPVGNFHTMADVVRSQTAMRQGIDNLAPFTAQHYANVCALSDALITPISRQLRLPDISSWFRCAELNRHISGSATSQHCQGQAVDFTIPFWPLTEVYNWIAFESKLPFDQVIYEYGSWIHVSYDAQRTRGQRLRIDRNGTRRVLKPLAA